VPNPANALKFVACVSASGTPDCSVTIGDTLQPRIRHVALATNTCGISPLDTSRSSARLKASATGALAGGPVRIDASNTDEASSISRDRV